LGIARIENVINIEKEYHYVVELRLLRYFGLTGYLCRGLLIEKTHSKAAQQSLDRLEHKSAHDFILDRFHDIIDFRAVKVE